jgi:hypothetical protein
MHRLIVAIGLYVLLAACGRSVPPPTQQELGRVEAEWMALMDAYDDCVLHSSRNAFKSGRDRYLAVEVGFQACATEERAFRNRLSGISPTFASQEIDKHKSKLKTLLVQILPADGVKTLAGRSSGP